LQNHAVLALHREFWTRGTDACWCFSIRYGERVDANSRSSGGRRGRVDYKNELEPEAFARFAELRVRRKAIAEAESLPAYAVFTDEELAGIARITAPDLAALKSVRGIGPKKVERFTGSPDTGLPIGNLTSQYFANHYLSGLDHWIKESLRVPGYVRYMDDMVLFGASVSELSAWETEIRTSVASRLGLELKPGILNRTQEGLPFLGFVLTPMGARLSSRSSRRVRRNVRTVTALLTSGRISQATAGDRVRAMLARTDWTGDGARTRRRLLGRCSRRRTASTAAAAGTTTPGGVAPPTATGTTRATAGTTRGSGSSSPTARGKGWMSPVEQSSGPVPACGGKSAKGGPVLVAAAAPPVERSGPPAFFKPPQGETE
jgi:hypothetical protein